MDVRTLLRSIGKVIASSGTVDFPRSIHHLIAAAVSFDRLDITEWQVDRSTNRILSVTLLGEYGAVPFIRRLDAHTHAIPGPLLPCEHTVQRIIQLDGAQIILDRIPSQWRSEAGAQLSRCHLVSSRDDRRYLITLRRCDNRGDFSAEELICLQDLSEAVLPCVERHTLRPAGTVHSDKPATIDSPTSGGALLQSRFLQRIRADGISLSPREIEVCGAVLTGRTIPELADEMALKTSTVETYIRRATFKLGVNGRHGLMKWSLTRMSGSVTTHERTPAVRAATARAHATAPARADLARRKPDRPDLLIRSRD